MDTAALGPWGTLLKEEWEKTYVAALEHRVDAARASAEVYPPEGETFRALQLTPPEAVRVVILGQDPYHEPGQANGLAFSVRAGVALPPSLRNIYRELKDDLGVDGPVGGDLTPWAGQGVLLLNSVLTVERGKANAHKDYGWQTFTDAVIAAVAKLPQPVAFVLWGAQAGKKAAAASLSPYPRLVLQGPHPSPLSAYRGFFGSKPFSKINDFLMAHGENPIDFSGGGA